jgi:hypothetical protein
MGGPGEQHLLYRDGVSKPEVVKPGTTGAQVKIGLPIYDVNDKTPKLLQLSVPTFRDLAELVAELGEDRVYRVKRTGSGKTDTKYSVTSIGPSDDATRTALADEAPVDLEGNGFRPLQVVPSQPADDSGIPF